MRIANNSPLYHIRWVWSGISCKNVADIRWLGDRNMICQIYVMCKNHSLQNHVLPLIYTLSEITWNPIWMKRIEMNNKWYCQNIQISWEFFNLVRIALCQKISNHTWLKTFSTSYVLSMFILHVPYKKKYYITIFEIEF